MALIAFNADLQFADSMYGESSPILSDREIEEAFDGMDEASVALAKKFMHRQYRCNRNGFMVHPKYFYEEDEKAEYKKIVPQLKKALKKYHLQGYQIGPESLYYHHGLRFAPDFVKENIKDKLFADVGGFLGDSAMVFFEYSPAAAIIFEPLAERRDILLKTMQKNHVDSRKYDLQAFALSDSNGVSEDGSMTLRRLDDAAGAYDIPFGVLKADIEGMGLKFIQGAKETIMRDRPLLTLSIYHNLDEFVGIYQTLKSWDISYHYEIKQFSPYTLHGEYSLFAYPQEWIH
jgi:hypothetical protein